MRRLGVLFAISLLASCDRAAESAEEQYNIVSNSKDVNAQCKAASKAADEWLKRENADKYNDWKLTRDIHCLNADLRRSTNLKP